jgi:hypothetical protein
MGWPDCSARTSASRSALCEARRRMEKCPTSKLANKKAIIQKLQRVLQSVDVRCRSDPSSSFRRRTRLALKGAAHSLISMEACAVPTAGIELPKIIRQAAESCAWSTESVTKVSTTRPKSYLCVRNVCWRTSSAETIYTALWSRRAAAALPRVHVLTRTCARSRPLPVAVRDFISAWIRRARAL